MNELLETYDGESYAAFSQKDIYMVRVQTLYRWITCGVFDINIREVLGYSGGIAFSFLFAFLLVCILVLFFWSSYFILSTRPLSIFLSTRSSIFPVCPSFCGFCVADLWLDEPKFSLFEGQCETLEIQVILDDEILKSVQAVKVKKGGVESKSKGVACAVLKVVDRGVESDDDSFMPPAPKKCLRPIASSPIKVAVKSPLVLSDDDDDFVLHGERTVFTRSKSVEEPLVVSNKRLVSLSTRLRMHVHALKPFKFPFVAVAKQTLDLILSKEFLDKYAEVPLFKCTPPTGDDFIVDAKCLVTCFGPAGCIDTELMDLLISYWKGSPECNHVYKSGDRVLLSPYVINYLLEIDPYHRPVDEDGQEVSGPPFNVKLAAQKFKLYIKENLLTANLIKLPYWNLNHFTLYTINKYRESLDIHDSWRYTGRNLSRNRFHGERVEIICDVHDVVVDEGGVWLSWIQLFKAAPLGTSGR
ncbi:uncharacterized protein LOC119319347 isoform X2 [Triticum dicoccoides]|uniref:uncharacterized protein LOC119319347 isoform X2 n=1 Tax=Triticum dicoccoides TaxID=85692 RepID=UPI001891D701|nr:uncharacterized protein LOC119319347 isoform X2 [Triticum dicoccoides]